MNAKLLFNTSAIVEALTGLALLVAPLCDRTVAGRRIGIRPNDPNPAYDVVKHKFRKSGSGKIDGWDLKLFP